MAKKRWMGSAPAKCDICGSKIGRFFVDGKTRMGPWACMCGSCHRSKGVGLGTGKGQRYSLDVESGNWYKDGG